MISSAACLIIKAAPSTTVGVRHGGRGTAALMRDCQPSLGKQMGPVGRAGIVGTGIYKGGLSQYVLKHQPALAERGARKAVFAIHGRATPGCPEHVNPDE